MSRSQEARFSRLGVPWKTGVHYFLLSSRNPYHSLKVPLRDKWSPQSTIITDVLDIPLSSLPTASSSGSAKPSDRNVPKGSANGKAHIIRCNSNSKKWGGLEGKESNGENPIQKIAECLERGIPKMLPRKRPRSVCRSCTHQKDMGSRGAPTMESAHFRAFQDGASLPSCTEDVAGFSCIIGRQSLCLKSTLGEDRTVSRALFKLSCPVVMRTDGLVSTLAMPRDQERSRGANDEMRNAKECEEALRTPSRHLSVGCEDHAASPSVSLSTAQRYQRRPLSPSSALQDELEDEVAVNMARTSPSTLSGEKTCRASVSVSSEGPSYSAPKLQLPPLHLEILSSTSFLSILDRHGNPKAPAYTELYRGKQLPATSTFSTLSHHPNESDHHSTSPSPNSECFPLQASTLSFDDDHSKGATFPFTGYYSIPHFMPSSFADSRILHSHKLLPGYRTWLSVGDSILVKGVRLELCAFIWIHNDINPTERANDTMWIMERQGDAKLSEEYAFHWGKNHFPVFPSPVARHHSIARVIGESRALNAGPLPLLCSSPHPLYAFPVSALSLPTLSIDMIQDVPDDPHSVIFLPILPFSRVEWLELRPWMQHQLLVHYWNVSMRETRRKLPPVSASPSAVGATHNIEFQHLKEGDQQVRKLHFPFRSSPSSSSTLSVSPFLQSWSGEFFDGGMRHDASTGGDCREKRNGKLPDAKGSLHSHLLKSPIIRNTDSEEDAATPSSQWLTDKRSLSESEYLLAPPLSALVPHPLFHCIEELEVEQAKEKVESIAKALGKAASSLQTPQNKANGEESILLCRGRFSSTPSQPPISSTSMMERYSSFGRGSSTGRESLIDATSLFQQQLDALLGEVHSSSQDNTLVRVSPGSGLTLGVSRASTNLGEGDSTEGSQQQNACALGSVVEYPGKMIQESVDVCYYD